MMNSLLLIEDIDLITVLTAAASDDASMDACDCDCGPDCECGCC
jgi:hypothetical protein